MQASVTICRTCCTDVAFVDVYIEFEFLVMIGLQV